MALTAKIVIGLLIVGGVFWALTVRRPATQSSTQGPGVQQGQQTGNQQGSGSAQISASASSDAALQTDLNSVDAQLQAASNDSASVDQGMNDKPVQQIE